MVYSIPDHLDNNNSPLKPFGQFGNEELGSRIVVSLNHQMPDTKDHNSQSDYAQSPRSPLSSCSIYRS